MLMSKSRLEKFLYALYSLDYSDLPTPLSRIEKLYNCLVTGGEVPTFEPLSRVEKYLMAILGVYNVDELPNPLSRVEVLLYKLATGVDNSDDVKSFLSEHEELLAEIIRNGGAGGNIDIEYVLYTLSTEFNTLYNTAEKPVKSAILKGHTLVNLSTFKNNSITRSASSGYISISDITQIKPSTDYTFIYYVTLSNITSVGNSIESVDYIDSYFPKLSLTETQANRSYILKFKQTSKDDISNSKRLGLKFVLLSGTATIEKAIIIEGDYTNIDIPYFEGIQSVKMPVLTTTGKNLFDGGLEKGGLSVDNGLPINNQLDRYRSKNYTKVKTSTSYVIYNNYSSMIGLREFDENYNLVSWTTIHSSKAFTTSNNTKYLKFIIVNSNDDNLVQLEESSIVTTYEPYQSNILTTNEEVKLRGIGGVKDELNLLTGELTQRVGKIVLDENQNWSHDKGGSLENTNIFYTGTIENMKPLGTSQRANGLLCYDIPVIPTLYFEDARGVMSNTDPRIYVRIEKTIAPDVKSFITWLSLNPITLKYLFETPMVKTVDLSTVNQDGNNTKLSTFNDITHVTLSSEGLIPEVKLRVATKNEEVLNTMGLEMDDISTTQNALKETSNTQSENVDATMIATTEIYEELI